jgi:hypothetical protein
MLTTTLLLFGSLFHADGYKPVVNPLKEYKSVLCWHQVWDGSDWKWTPADVCPVCFHHVVPKPAPNPFDDFICPECHSATPDIEWDTFNMWRYWWIGWPSELSNGEVHRIDCPDEIQIMH